MYFKEGVIMTICFFLLITVATAAIFILDVREINRLNLKGIAIYDNDGSESESAQ